MTEPETEINYSQCALDLREAILRADRLAINEFTARIEPFVKNIAATIARCANAQELDEFCNDSVAELVLPRATTEARIVDYDEQLGDFGSWVKTCLARIWVSKKRSATKRYKTQGLTNLDVVAAGIEPGRKDSVPWLFQETIEIMNYPFTFCDLRCIATWNVRERLELLVLSGLFVRLPQLVWEQFVSDYESEMHVSLVRPFPCLIVAERDDRYALTEQLSVSIGARRTTMDQRWSRGQSKLLMIPSMRRVFQQWVAASVKR